MTVVRCKFQLQEIAFNAWSSTSRRLKFAAVYDTTIPEDRRFAKATPSGEFWMQVDNPVALEQFKLGGYYYFDITPYVPPQEA